MARKYGFYINGQYVHTSQWKRVPNALEPNETLGEVAFLEGELNHESKEIWEACLEGSQLSFQQMQINGFFPLQERLAFLNRLAKRIEDQQENLAQLIMQEVGKPLQLARAEVLRSLITINNCIEVAPLVLEKKTALDFKNHPQWNSFDGYWLREARGTLLAITPFNFPLNLVIHKIAPALAVGCPVILKPSDKASLIALCLADYCHAEGLPAGLLNVINCDHPLTKSLIHDPRIQHISFTGSSQVGWELRRQTHKPLFLELGGAAPTYVDQNSNLSLAATQLASSSFAYAGQTCISTQSIWIHETVYSDFVEEFKNSMNALNCGLAAREDVLCSGLISDDAVNRVNKLIEESLLEGALMTTYSNPLLEKGSINPVLFEKTGWKTRFVSPRYFENLPNESKLLKEEAFAPLVYLQKVKNFDEYFKWAQRLEHRLQTAVFSNDEELLNRASHELPFGGVVLNASPSHRYDPMPYGGRGLSGSGREGPAFAMEDYTEIKSVLKKL